MNPTAARQALAKAVGTAMLLIAVIGSGIAASRLSPGDTGLQLLGERGGHRGRAGGHHLGRGSGLARGAGLGPA